MAFDVPRLAAQGYFAYGERVNWLNHRGANMPPWEELPDLQKDAWCEAVDEVLRRADPDALPSAPGESPIPVRPDSHVLLCSACGLFPNLTHLQMNQHVFEFHTSDNPKPSCYEMPAWLIKS